MTNRDLYLLIGRFETTRSLEDYLSALWNVTEPCRHVDALPPHVFAELLAAALTAEPRPQKLRERALRRSEAGAVRANDDALPVSESGYAAFEATIAEQIVDLHEMALGGQLADEYRYFGINSPRGSRWYNFDPCTYLECAMAGTFGGWREGDDTGRAYVPGPVAVFDSEGDITSVDPRSLEDPIEALPPIAWEDFGHFLRMGQYYE